MPFLRSMRKLEMYLSAHGNVILPLDDAVTESSSLPEALTSRFKLPYAIAAYALIAPVA